MDLIQYMQQVGHPLNPAQEAAIRALMKRHCIEVLVTPRRYSSTSDVQISTHMSMIGGQIQELKQLYSCIEYRHIPTVTARSRGIKSRNAGPHWVLDKYNIPSPPSRHMDIPSTTQALLSRIGV